MQIRSASGAGNQSGRFQRIVRSVVGFQLDYPAVLNVSHQQASSAAVVRGAGGSYLLYFRFHMILKKYMMYKRYSKRQRRDQSWLQDRVSVCQAGAQDEQEKESFVKPVVLGVDIGGSNSRLGFVNEEGTVLAKARMPTHRFEPPELLWRRIWKETVRLWQELQSSGVVEDSDWKAIGIGAPNAHGGRGSVEHPPNLNWEVVDFLKIVSTYSSRPSWLGNDANVAALGEGRFGAAAGIADYVLVTLGTGIGSGLVVGGRLVEGESGFAAELGHIPLVENGRRCGCGRKGCLETYASANGLRRTVLELLAGGDLPSELGAVPFDEMTAELVAKAAERGDALAREAFAVTAGYLARGLSMVIHMLSPAAIFIGGGLSLSGDLLMNPLLEKIDGQLMPVFRKTTKISLARIPEADLGVLGAAALAFSHL